MKYEDKNFGFSFELKEGWRHNTKYLQPTFHCPGYVGEIVVDLAQCAPEYVKPENRTKHLGLPGATTSQISMGGEANAVVFQNAHDTAISVVRDGIHYTINHSNNPSTQEAVELLKKTWRFPSKAQAESATKQSSSPAAQAVARALRSESPEAAKEALNQAEFSSQRVAGGTVYDLKPPKRRLGETDRSAGRPWWRFWE